METIIPIVLVVLIIMNTAEIRWLRKKVDRLEVSLGKKKSK